MKIKRKKFKVLRRIIKKYILKIINKIETIEYKNISSNFDQDDPNKKIIAEYDIDEYVLADRGYVKAYKYLETQPYNVWFIETNKGKTLDCADNHILFDPLYNEVFVKDLSVGDFILTKDGAERITYIENTGIPVSMVDLSINHYNHRYYTNDVLSHNSITSSIMLVWYLIFNHDKNAMILANVGDTAEELMDKIKTIIKGLPFFLKPGIIVNNVMTMRFDNNCRILAKTTTKTSGIGFTIHFLYMDEFAHINPNFIESFFRSTYPTVSSSEVARIIISSTPNGMNKFYELYNDALNGLNDFTPIRVDWWQVPGRDEKWKQSEIGNLGSEELFNQEYGNQFLSSSSLLLGSEELKKIKANEIEYVWREISDLHYADLNYENLLWHPKFNIDNANSNGKRFVLTIDISAGVKGDFSVINIFKVTPLPKNIIKNMTKFEDESNFFGLIQIGILRDNEIKIEELVKIINILSKNVFGLDRCKLAVEMNFKGELLFEKLMADDDFYESIFLFTKHSEAARNKKPGIKYNEKNKMKYCEIIRSLIRENIILLNDKNWTIRELFTFGLNNRGTYSSQSGHDDAVMSVINLASLFDSNDFNYIVGDLFDEIDNDNEYKKIIIDKLEGDIIKDADDPFSKISLKTKDGKSYSEFSNLI